MTAVMPESDAQRLQELYAARMRERSEDRAGAAPEPIFRLREVRAESKNPNMIQCCIR